MSYYPKHYVSARDTFQNFHTANPQVYAMLLKLARQVAESGKKRFGIAAIYERLRWMSTFETEGDPFKLNNNYRAFYTRLLSKEPGLEGFFATRFSAADRV